MKKSIIFLFGVLGLMATSCEDALEPAIPQHNPQGPVLESGDIETVKAGVLASDAVLTLENYRADDARLGIVKLEKADSLPANAEISYKFELSSTDDFARSYTIDATLGEDSTYTVSASDWNEAHLYLFGKSPKEKTAYYRVPVYVNVNGSDYRYESTSYYAVTGSIKETCFDQGFVIEDHYYLLGSMSTWALDNAAEVEKYPFYHNPDVSPYDDPVFTIVFSVSQAVLDANGGGCYWKIAPQSVVGTDKWSNVIGTETDGDESEQGMLVTENAGSGKITKAGKYELTVNMEEMTYSLKSLASVLYVVGEPNGWSIDNDAVYLTETSQGSNIYSGTIKVDAGKFMFRFYTQLGDWDRNSVGADDDPNVNVPVTFNEAGEYTSVIAQAGVNATSGKGNWTDASWEGGAVSITVNLNDNTVVMKKASLASGIYLRGDMNGWGADAAWEFQLTDKTNVWTVSGVSISQGQGFKVADANWGAVNLGAESGNTNITAGVPFPLIGGENIVMSADFTGEAVLSNVNGVYSLLLNATE